MMVPTGLAIPRPAISGAEPWMGSYKPRLPSPREAEGSNPSEPGQHRGLIGQDVAKHVLGDEHVKVARPADQMHGGGIHQHMVERHVRQIPSS